MLLHPITKEKIIQGNNKFQFLIVNPRNTTSFHTIQHSFYCCYNCFPSFPFLVVSKFNESFPGYIQGNVIKIQEMLKFSTWLAPLRCKKEEIPVHFSILIKILVNNWKIVLRKLLFSWRNNFYGIYHTINFDCNTNFDNPLHYFHIFWGNKKM